MKIVAFHHHGQPGVGLLSADAQFISPFDMSAAQRALGALPLVEMQAAGQSLPALLAPVVLADVQVTAPLPKPRHTAPLAPHVLRAMLPPAGIGAQVHYLWLPHRGRIYLMFVYGKNEASNLTPDQKKRLREVVGQIKRSSDTETRT